jgi:3-phenylpropionate/trans-cinnamate dioxygenase ferredoxin reductase subunit
MVGLVQGCDETVVLGSAETRSLSVLCFRHKHLIAVESVNRAADHVAARRLLARTSTLSPQEAAALRFDLKTYEALSR